MRDERNATDAIARLLRGMMAKLERDHHKPGWRGLDVETLHRGLIVEVLELGEALHRGESTDAVWLEAADVANYAMMVADCYAQWRKP